MNVLLKIYSKKFAQDALYLFLLLWPIAYLIKYISANAEYMSSIIFSLFSCFYSILFFFNYPLRDCLKWVLNTPMPKRELIFFNLLFQLIKITIIGFFLFILIWIMKIIEPLYQWIPTETAHGPLPVMAKKIDLSLNSLIFDSTIVFSVLLFLTFLVAIIFNVSPKMFMEAKNQIGGKKSYYFFLLQKYKKYAICCIPLPFLLKFLHGHWSSPLFIVSLGISYLLFATCWSYATQLNLGSIIKRRVIYGGITLFFVTFSFCYSYSQNRLTSPKALASTKVNELFFQKSFHKELSQQELISLLESPLSLDDLKFLVKSSQKAREDSQGNSFAKNLNFKQFVSTKNDIRALEYSLRFFPLNHLSFDDLNFFIESWAKLNQKHRKSENHPLIKGLKQLPLPLLLTRDTSSNHLLSLIEAFPFQEKDIAEWIKSKERIKQILGISLSSRWKSEELTKVISEEIMNLDPDVFVLAGRILSQKKGRNLSSLDLYSIHQEEKKLKTEKK